MVKVSNTSSAVIISVSGKELNNKIVKNLGPASNGFKIEAISPNVFKLLGNATMSPLHGSGYRVFKRSSGGQRKAKIFSISLANLPRKLLGPVFGSSVASMSLQKDLDGTYFYEIVVLEKDKVQPLKRKVQAKRVAIEQQVQTVPIPLPVGEAQDDDIVNLESLFKARRMINTMLKNHGETGFSISIDKGELQFSTDSVLTESLMSGLKETINGSGPGPGAPIQPPVVAKPSIFSYFRRGK